jgi:subtilisin family serine protease
VSLTAPVLIAALGIAASVAPVTGTPARGSASPWIVALRSDADAQSVLASANAGLGVRAEHRFSHVIKGFSARLTGAQRRALLGDPRVAAIVPDGVVRATGDPAQEAQPGIRRVGATQNPDRTGATLDVDVAVVDTGIQPNNPDLNVVGGYNCTNPGQSEAERKLPSSWADGTGFGHGTHVAGIAAARNDGSGVEGVAAGARLWAIKVLTDSGLGYWSWVICGLDHVAEMTDPSNPARPRVEVVNMSLAGPGFDDGNCGNSNDDPLHHAVCRLERIGVTMVVAAGNNRNDARFNIPASYDEVITVSALADYDGQAGGDGNPPNGCGSADGVNAGRQGDDAFANFSDFGRDVDLIAPGVCVLSTLPNNRFGRMTGTSMATPHVAGGAALYYLSEQNRGHARPTTREVKAALIAAGNDSWRQGTDLDKFHEPLLDVSSFNLAPDFRIGSTPQVRVVSGGASPSFDIWLARLDGFNGTVSISVANSTLPPGATAEVDENAAGLPRGAVAEVTINIPGSSAPGTYDVDVRGTSGGAVRTTTVRLVIEHAANGGPSMHIRSTQTSGFAIPARVSWPASGGDYQLQSSRDGGRWKTIARTTATRLDMSIWPGSRYQFRVRSGDGDWKYGASSVFVPKYPPADVELSGNWQRDASFLSYGELPIYSTQAGASARLHFVGRGVAWIATKGPSRGRANVYLDGSLVQQVDLVASFNKPRQIVFSHSWASFGSHTLRIEVLGAPQNRPRVDLDALMVVAH